MPLCIVEFQISVIAQFTLQLIDASRGKSGEDKEMGRVLERGGRLGEGGTRETRERGRTRKI
ncbi:hypothetical protein PI95_001240 [Hassallia byssoidea VB512170]|uniref:Uncharacterized protein n=1 Tax=Hassallia byssoidea VB512170 TaxID=1304833 RepID=A0A846H3T9_9CYAN|nr:hypothetical protein [Hassalia byssoidea]NEU71239.1 hypothetical protein [Hassalia byssoidea VB512170]